MPFPVGQRLILLSSALEQPLCKTTPESTQALP